MMELTAELMYCAGYFDGEGTITLMTMTGTGTKCKSLYLRIALATGDRESLSVFARLFGGTVTAERRRATTKRPIFAWRRNGPKAQEVLKRLAPLLIAKKSKAQAALTLDYKRKGPIRLSNVEKLNREVVRKMPGY